MRQEELPAILRTDMGSLTQDHGGDDYESEPMSMQQRVIQSGLDSINGRDAPMIVALFKAMAVFAEDQVVTLLIANVLWWSLAVHHTLLSAIKLRRMYTSFRPVWVVLF